MSKDNHNYKEMVCPCNTDARCLMNGPCRECAEYKVWLKEWERKEEKKRPRQCPHTLMSFGGLNATCLACGKTATAILREQGKPP